MTTEQRTRIDELEQRVIQAGPLADRVKQALEHMLSAAVAGDVKMANLQHDQALDACEELESFVEGAGHYFDGMGSPPYVDKAATNEDAERSAIDELMHAYSILGTVRTSLLSSDRFKVESERRALSTFIENVVDECSAVCGLVEVSDVKQARIRLDGLEIHVEILQLSVDFEVHSNEHWAIEAAYSCIERTIEALN